jgi:hypothetical protein
MLAAVITALGLASHAWAAAENDWYQVKYAANLNIGDSKVNLTNTGVQGGEDPLGRICANVYVLDPAEDMVACCSCVLKPNGLYNLSATSDLISNTLTPAVPTSITIKLVATLPINGTTCNASAPTLSTLARGMRAWGTTVHALPAAGTYGVTETEFSRSALSGSELRRLTSDCGSIQTNGGGFGICRSCRLGAQ